MRILVTGSRDWPDDGTVENALDKAVTFYALQHSDRFITEGYTVVTGACPTGADAYAERWANKHFHPPERYPAKWRRHDGTLNRAAGHERNALMVGLGADVCLAFLMPCRKPDCRDPEPHYSHGTTNCVTLAQNRGIKVIRHHGVSTSEQPEPD